MPNNPEQRVFNAIHAPLSEFFDAYVIVGYSAGARDRIVMMHTRDKVFRDALSKPVEAASDWMNDGRSLDDGQSWKGEGQ